MERLAKEKISSQQRIIVLKRELSSQYENIDFSTILPESDAPTNSIRERGNFIYKNPAIFIGSANLVYCDIGPLKAIRVH